LINFQVGQFSLAREPFGFNLVIEIKNEI
jgi:hypothetical protein